MQPNKVNNRLSPISALAKAGIGFDGSPLPEKTEVQNNGIKNGDQIIATEDAYFTFAPEKISQRKGDIMLVNNPRTIGGTYLNNWNDTNRIGLGIHFKPGTFRIATPDDEGYVATRQQWESIKDQEIRKLKKELTVLRIGVFACFCIIAFALYGVASCAA